MATLRFPRHDRLLRSLLLVAGTAAVPIAGFAVLALDLPGLSLRMMLLPPLVLLYLALPLFAVPLHYRWQKPAESSVVLAFVTGVSSWGLAWVGAAWFSLDGVGC